jgi:hypothetical protein
MRPWHPVLDELAEDAPIEITSSSGRKRKQIVRRLFGSLLLLRIFAPRALNTSPFTAPGDRTARRATTSWLGRAGEPDRAIDSVSQVTACSISSGVHCTVEQPGRRDASGRRRRST